MLNNEKIRVMTHLAIGEEKIKRGDENLEQLNRKDYLYSAMIRSFLAGTAGFAVMLAIYIFYDLENIMLRIFTGEIAPVLLLALGAYIIFIALYMIVAFQVYRERYDSAHRRMQRMNRLFRNLRNLYDEKENG